MNNYTYSKTISVQYQRILSNDFEEEDFQKFVNRSLIFAFFHFQSSAEMPVCGVSQ